MRDGEKISVTAPVVVSDIGPAATVALLGEENVPADYQDLVKKGDRPTADDLGQLRQPGAACRRPRAC